ncbi:hypothetical protein GCM10023222_34990 [Saccharopolyspora cebuensis]
MITRKEAIGHRPPASAHDRNFPSILPMEFSAPSSKGRSALGGQDCPAGPSEAPREYESILTDSFGTVYARI